MRVTFYRWAFGLCALGVLILSLLPPSSALPTTGWDKSNHVLAFAVLALLSRPAWPQRILTCLAMLLAYGGLIEVLQSFTPNRQADFSDLLADAVGLAVGGLVARVLARRGAV